MSAIPRWKIVVYPDSDGQPVADNDLQYRVMADLRHALDIRYEADPDVYVSTDLLIYYVEGDPTVRVAPDVFVAFGVGKGDRGSYRVWEEGRLPDVVFEVASHLSWPEILGSKKDQYEKIGFPEYIVFDPEGEFIQPRLQGFRLQNGRYRPIPLEADGSLESRTTGLRIEPEGKNLRLVDLETGQSYPWAKEEAAARKAAEERAAQEAVARRAAEERAAWLEEELARLRAGLGAGGPEGGPQG